MERTSKLCSLKEAVNLVHDGDRIGFGGFAVYQKPMAVIHELIRSNKKELTVVGSLNSIDVDMLAGSGCLKIVETSYVGLEKFGLAQNYRREVQNGNVKVIHYPELISWDRFRANAEGLEFWPVTYLGGSDIVNKNPLIKEFKSPMSGRPMYAIPAADIDVAIIHAYAADIYGNIQIQSRHMLPQSMNIAVSRSCRKIIVSVEKIISTEEIRNAPHLTTIPAFRTTCVVHVPNGAHPTAVLGVNLMDDEFFKMYVEVSASKEYFEKFLDKYIYGVKNYDEYLDYIGRDHLKELDEVEGAQ